jgi:hypothetical protein
MGRLVGNPPAKVNQPSSHLPRDFLAQREPFAHSFARYLDTRAIGRTRAHNAGRNRL